MDLIGNKRSLLLLILWGFFITNAMIAEVIGVKLIDVGRELDPGVFIMSVGILPWPVVFLTTDILNEFYGKKVVRRLSLITAFLIAYAFIIIYTAISIPSFEYPGGPSQSEFVKIFGQSLAIIIGSITAFLVAQVVDVFVYWFFRKRTGEKMIWLRATGSTAVSQLVDTFIVLFIAFRLTGKMNNEQFVNAFITGYTVKLIIAVCLTPLIYLGHRLVRNYLGERKNTI